MTTFWESPTRVIHAGEFLCMKTLCGTRVPPIGSGWGVVVGPATCERCLRALAPRPTAVSIDSDGVRTVSCQ
jgi:hypothetical protein